MLDFFSDNRFFRSNKEAAKKRYLNRSLTKCKKKEVI